MICAPDHVKKYVRQIVGKNKFFDNNLGNNEFAFEDDEWTFKICIGTIK